MKFRMEVNLDGDAFREERAHELNRLLQLVCERILQGAVYTALIDINGKTVGHWSINDVTPVVICVRDPDAANDYTTYDTGDLRIIDVDLGYMELRDPEEFLDWAEREIANAEGTLPAGHPAREYLLDVVESIRDAHHGERYADLAAVKAAIDEREF